MLRRPEPIPFLLYSSDGSPYDINNECKSVCWWDTEPFEGRAIPVPRKYNERTKKWEVFGVYCSPQCAKAAMFHDHKDSHLRLEWFKLMLYEVYGWDKKKGVKCAFPRSELKKFNPLHGMDIVDFRQGSEQYTMEIVHPPRMILTHAVWLSSKASPPESQPEKVLTTTSVSRVTHQPKRAPYEFHSLEGMFKKNIQKTKVVKQ